MLVQINAINPWSETCGATAVFLVNGEQITFEFVTVGLPHVQGMNGDERFCQLFDADLLFQRDVFGLMYRAIQGETLEYPIELTYPLYTDPVGP